MSFVDSRQIFVHNLETFLAKCFIIGTQQEKNTNYSSFGNVILISDSSPPLFSITIMKSCHILWSTQSGRAKACARRTRRILSERTSVTIQDVGFPFDETPTPFLDWVSTNIGDSQGQEQEHFLLMFVSTTGDGEHCDSISATWNALLQKSLPKTLFQGKRFALFCLGDRAYGPQFCAAGRKLAVRLLQLGMSRICDVGYGDDNTPSGGVFRDLDEWLEQVLVPKLQDEQGGEKPSRLTKIPMAIPENPFRVVESKPKELIANGRQHVRDEWRDPRYAEAYQRYFSQACPLRAYTYDSNLARATQLGTGKLPPLQGTIVENRRISAADWDQDTRHIQIHVHSTGSKDVPFATPETLPYQAGDVATLLPCNSDDEVTRFLAALPPNLQTMAETAIQIQTEDSLMNNSFIQWPSNCTFRGWLKYCADIHALPEREDLRALSAYCSEEHEMGADQRDKLCSLSETSGAALYADYILREKRSWVDVLYDFESLRSPGSKLTIEALLVLLPSIRPRDYSIASAPTLDAFSDEKEGFCIELCVAIVRGRTRLGRSYSGLCSDFLSNQVTSPTDMALSSPLQLWIRPGSFGNLPLELAENGSFQVPLLCVGAGTGVAPMRSLLRERHAVQTAQMSSNEPVQQSSSGDPNNNILVFGCRRKAADYYYKDEWENDLHQVRVLTAFSRDQFQKIYVQKVLREADNGTLIVAHLLEKKGAVYIAGGPKMARAVKEEIVEALGKVLEGGEKHATQFLNKLQRLGKFSTEAWS